MRAGAKCHARVEDNGLAAAVGRLLSGIVSMPARGNPEPGADTDWFKLGLRQADPVLMGDRTAMDVGRGGQILLGEGLSNQPTAFGLVFAEHDHFRGAPANGGHRHVGFAEYRLLGGSAGVIVKHFDAERTGLKQRVAERIRFVLADDKAQLEPGPRVVRRAHLPFLWASISSR